MSEANELNCTDLPEHSWLTVNCHGSLGINAMLAQVLLPRRILVAYVGVWKKALEHNGATMSKRIIYSGLKFKSGGIWRVEDLDAFVGVRNERYMLQAHLEEVRLLQKEIRRSKGMAAEN